MTKAEFKNAYNEDDLHGRRPNAEDNLKVLIVEYLSNH